MGVAGTEGDDAAGCEPGVAEPDAGAVGPGDGVVVGWPGRTGMLDGIPCSPAVGAIEVPRALCRAISARASEVAMKIAARITVVRDKAFAAPRPDIRPETPPPPPKPSAPPSERCRRMVPIMAMVTMN